MPVEQTADRPTSDGEPNQPSQVGPPEIDVRYTKVSAHVGDEQTEVDAAHASGHHPNRSQSDNHHPAVIKGPLIRFKRVSQINTPSA